MFLIFFLRPIDTFQILTKDYESIKELLRFMVDLFCIEANNG